ncbi:MAG: hypothetical protein O3C21_07445 [Verrucomicrobia bacterium]|nr:hypothetical protein [Verrucomicrobiota bacterium]
MCGQTKTITIVTALANLSVAVSLSHAIDFDFTVSAAQVTASRTVDEGFRTFSAPSGKLPVSKSLSANEAFDFDAFLLFTDESKVNSEEPAGGDGTPYPITATVTFTSPVATTLTFTGTTVGEEDFSVVPASAQVSQFALIAWGTANPDLAGLALGRGRVSWDGPQSFDLGGGLTAVVTLKPVVYNDGLQLRGPGVGRAGTVEAEVKVTSDAGPRKAAFAVRNVKLMGDMMEVEWESELDRLYQVQTTQGDGQINFTDGPATIVGKAGTTSSMVPVPAGTEELYVRVVVLQPQ